jgi:hypothetical protein
MTVLLNKTLVLSLTSQPIEGEDHQSQASFTLHYNTTLIHNIFWLKYKKCEKGEKKAVCTNCS